MPFLSTFGAASARSKGRGLAGGPTAITINGTTYDLLTGGPVTIATWGRHVIDAPAGLQVKLQIWGAGGGTSGKGGAGGYAAGVYTFSGAQHLVIVGQAGPTAPASDSSAYPDGGISRTYGSCGGGSSRFGLFVAEANQNAAATAYYLIAGGGGGGHDYSGFTGGAGGGLSGQTSLDSNYGAGLGGGGTQSAGGAGGVASSYGGVGGAGSKYKGGDGGVSSPYGRGGSGGGGYYGGGAGGTVYAGGGGGSGYVDATKISTSVLTAGNYATPVTPAENNRPTGRGGSAQDGAVIITLVS